MTEQKKSAKKFEIKRIIWTIVVLIAIVMMSFIIITKMKTANAIRESEEQKSLEKMFDDCKCIEKEMVECSSGFELKNGICKNETLKIFTNILKGCSEYSCSENRYVFNLTTQKWGIKK